MSESKCRQRSPLPHLHHELLFSHVLPRLPARSLFRFSCASKLWHTTIGDSKFIASHFLHSQSSPHLLGIFADDNKKPEHLIFNLDDINVEGEEGGLMDLEKLRKATIAGPYSHWVGSCNGFICFRSKFGFNLPDPITQEEIVLRFSFQICNPSTREVLVIPSPNVDEDFNCYEHYGFGFDALNNEYKVVCMYNSNKVVMVYTLGTGSWRSIPVPTHMPDHLSFVAEIPVFSDGALHWCTMESEHYNCEFFSFDIHSEELLMIPAPDPIHVMDNRPMFELQGCLCFPGYNESSLDLYKLKKDGNKHYWANHLEMMLFSHTLKLVLLVS